MSTIFQEDVGGDAQGLFQNCAAHVYGDFTDDGDNSDDFVNYDSEDDIFMSKLRWNVKYKYPVSRTKRSYARTVAERNGRPTPNRLSARLPMHPGPDCRMDTRRSGWYRSLQVHLPLASQHLPDHVANHATTVMESKQSQSQESMENLESMRSKATQCADDFDVTCNSSQVAESSAVTLMKPTTGLMPNTSCEICDLSHLDFSSVSTRLHKWENFEAFRLAAAAGCQGCDTIIDALRVWFTHVKSGVRPDLQSSLETCEVCLYAYYSRMEVLNRQFAVAPQIHLRWQIPGKGAESEEIKGSFHLYVFRPEGSVILESDVASRLNFVCRPLPLGDTASPQAFACLKEWLEVCTHCHPECSSIPDWTTLPKRILEITHKHIFLREDASSATRYACLSHCWGIDGVPLQLTETSVQRFKSGIALSQLPKTFRDAVEICLRLGIAYLWIDALCIVQDNLKDWETEAAAMADVYKNAFLTIAATAFKDSSGGCFSDPKSPFRARKLDRSILHVAERPVSDQRIQQGKIRNNPGDWPLLDRAWVYQERSLSRRIIHYTDTQLLWECKYAFKSESGNIDVDWSPNSVDRGSSGQVHHETPFKIRIPCNWDGWCRIVQDYSRLKLTFPKDRLPALAAIVKSMKSVRSNDTYICGLWRNSLLEHLMWEVINAQEERLTTPDVPSWSWASVADPVWYKDDNTIRLSVNLSLTYTPIEPPQLGRITDASISLRSRSCVGAIHRYERYFKCLRIRLDQAHLPWSACLKHIDMFPDYNFTASSQIVGEVDSIVVAFTQLQSNGFMREMPGPRGLILRKVSQDDYERIGTCEIRITRESFVRKRACLRDNFEWRYVRQFLASLPIRTFRIV